MATVQLVNRKAALTVPNVALVQDGGNFAVWVAEGAKPRKQTIELGVRGPVRSEIKSGIAAGTAVLLLPANAQQ
jgi:hypothetical protein